ncbi:MAG: hypothetical protein WBA93_07670 [Microcoleaceae cyanobacterium]
MGLRMRKAKVLNQLLGYYYWGVVSFNKSADLKLIRLVRLLDVIPPNSAKYVIPNSKNNAI